MVDGATGGGGYPAPRIYARTGIGYDSHRFEKGGPIILGGVKIPSDFHLAGHSDGDAIAHALTDAILGAVAAGDIGSMFPDTDPQNAGRDSIEMLTAARNVVMARGWMVIAADITVIAERPRIAAHREEMCRALSTALGLGSEALSIKGKTNEGMGWIGRGEGLACIAVATVAPLGGPAA